MQVDFLVVLLDFQWVIVFTLIVGILLGLCGYLFCRNLRWDQKSVKFLGLFLNLKNREILWLSAALLRCCFVMSVAIFCLKIESAHCYFFIILGIIYNLLQLRLPSLLFDVFNSVIIFAALLAGNILTGYLQDIVFDGRTFTIYLLLVVFIILYSLYFLLKDVGTLVTKTGRGSDAVIE